MAPPRSAAASLAVALELDAGSSRQFVAHQDTPRHVAPNRKSAVLNVLQKGHIVLDCPDTQLASGHVADWCALLHGGYALKKDLLEIFSPGSALVASSPLPAAQPRLWDSSLRYACDDDVPNPGKLLPHSLAAELASLLKAHGVAESELDARVATIWQKLPHKKVAIALHRTSATERMTVLIAAAKARGGFAVVSTTELLRANLGPELSVLAPASSEAASSTEYLDALTSDTNPHAQRAPPRSAAASLAVALELDAGSSRQFVALRDTPRHVAPNRKSAELNVLQKGHIVLVCPDTHLDSGLVADWCALLPGGFALKRDLLETFSTFSALVASSPWPAAKYLDELTSDTNPHAQRASAAASGSARPLTAFDGRVAPRPRGPRDRRPDPPGKRTLSPLSVGGRLPRRRTASLSCSPSSSHSIKDYG
jgi:hypothetical protein